MNTDREDWKVIYFDKPKFKGIIFKQNNTFIVTGHLKDELSDIKHINYWAGDPVPKTYSFSNTGKPFHNKDQAYTKKVNVGKAKVVNTKFTFSIEMPNSYYIDLGNNLVKPILNLGGENESEYEYIELSDGIPFRSLSLPSNHIESFQNLNFDANRSQHEILQANSFPKTNKTPPNFWGGNHVL